MKINKTKIKGLLVFKGFKHTDKRGYLRELLLEKKLIKNLNFILHQYLKKMFYVDYIFKLQNHKESLSL